MSCSASTQRQAVQLSGRRSLEDEHGRLRYKPCNGSGRSVNTSSARMGTDSESPPKITKRNAPVDLCSSSSGMRRETLREVSWEASISNEL
jgi:hypothetical protein